MQDSIEIKIENLNICSKYMRNKELNEDNNMIIKKKRSTSLCGHTELVSNS